MSETPIVVDAHTHVISDDTARYPLRPPGLAQGSGGSRRPADWFRTHPITAEGLLAEAATAGVDRVVFVQAMGAYGYDNTYCADAARAHPERATSVAIVDPGASDPGADLTHWVRERGMRGVRVFAIGGDEAFLDGEAGDAMFATAGVLGIPVVVATLSTGLARLARVVRRHPEVPVALDHCGFPDLRGGPPYAAAAPLFALAEHPSLHLKVSGLILGQVEAAGGRPADVVARLADAFGARRLLWGSDHPQTHDRSYTDLVRLCRDASADLSDDDRSWYLGRTACALWPELAA